MKNTQTKSTDKQQTKSLPDGRWFTLRKDSFSESRLIEIVVKSGVVVEQEESVDLSRIQLGKLVRRIGETFGEKTE
jgi:hypothetical protein